MKLVYLTDSDIPSRSANSLHVMKMCYEFAEAGHQVTLISLIKKDKLEPGVQDLYEFYGVANNFNIIRIPFLTKRFKKVYALIIACIAWFMRPDVAYGRNFHAVNFCAKLGMSSVYEGHHFFAPQAKASTVVALKKFLRRKTNKLLVLTSHSLLGSYQESFSVEVPTLVVHNGADEVKATTNNVTIRNTSLLNVGYIGHLYKGKGMEVISELVKQCPFAYFHIVGGTVKDINFWKHELAEYSNITFYGFKPHAETEAYRQEMDVLLAPYLADVEVTGGNMMSAKWMTPIKLFEYMASGKAIISSDLPVAKEVITNWENGVLCNPTKIEEWEAALAKFHQEPARTNQLGQNALATFQKDLSWKSRAGKIMSKLKEVV